MGPLLLASASTIRAEMLQNAGIAIEIQPGRVDEEAIRAALEAEGATPRDQADALAEMKARKVSERNPGRMVLGCDQVLELKGEVFSKAESPDAARAQLRALSGKTHRLLSAAVVYRDGQPLWRHVGEARLTMHALSEAYLEDYVLRNWESIRHSVGCYQIEKEGIRLMTRIEGDQFTIMGLPMLPLLTWLRLRGDIAG